MIDWQCPHPHCQNDYHRGPLTQTVASMLASHDFDPDYDAAADDSRVVCLGSEVHGPMPSPYREGWKGNTGWGAGVSATGYLSCIGNVDFNYDPIKVMLCTSEYIPSWGHMYKSDITHEVVGKGYTAGGIQLLNVTIKEHAGYFNVDAADVCWLGSEICARYAIVYQACSPGYLISRIDFGTDIQTNKGYKGSLTISWGPTGVLNMSKSVMSSGL